MHIYVQRPALVSGRLLDVRRVATQRTALAIFGRQQTQAPRGWHGRAIEAGKVGMLCGAYHAQTLLSPARIPGVGFAVSQMVAHGGHPLRFLRSACTLPRLAHAGPQLAAAYALGLLVGCERSAHGVDSGDAWAAQAADIVNQFGLLGAPQFALHRTAAGLRRAHHPVLALGAALGAAICALALELPRCFVAAVQLGLCLATGVLLVPAFGVLHAGASVFGQHGALVPGAGTPDLSPNTVSRSEEEKQAHQIRCLTTKVMQVADKDFSRLEGAFDQAVRTARASQMAAMTNKAGSSLYAAKQVSELVNDAARVFVRLSDMHTKLTALEGDAPRTRAGWHAPVDAPTYFVGAPLFAAKMARAEHLLDHMRGLPETLRGTQAKWSRYYGTARHPFSASPHASASSAGARGPNTPAASWSEQRPRTMPAAPRPRVAPLDAAPLRQLRALQTPQQVAQLLEAWARDGRSQSNLTALEAAYTLALKTGSRACQLRLARQALGECQQLGEFTRSYRKSLLLVHPDKLQARDLSPGAKALGKSCCAVLQGAHDLAKAAYA